MAKTVLIDIGPLVALLNKRDQYHIWVLDTFSDLEKDTILITNTAVIQECCFLLNRFHNGVNLLLKMIEEELILVQNPYPEKMGQIHTALLKYKNIDTSFADCCLLAMANSDKKSPVLTLDRDFHIYRNHSGKPLKLLSPYH